MRAVLTLAACGAGAYLLGAIPFGLIIARCRGIDIRRVGSGNIGATNVFRCVGKGWGLLTFALDVLKGFVSSFYLPQMAAQSSAGHLREVALLCGCLAVVGHNWPVFLRFKGGKGIATSLGALLGVARWAVLVGVLAWIVLFLLTRYVSVASMLAMVIVCVVAWVAREPGDVVLPIILTVLAAMALWRHKGNVQRLARGTEHRFSFRKKE